MPRKRTICSVADCGRPCAGNGLCAKHYQRWKHHGDPLIVKYQRKPREQRPCGVEECERPMLVHGYCSLHAQRLLRHGDPLMVLPPMGNPIPLEERIWAHVDKRSPEECWEWTSKRSPSGYGRILLDGKERQAHRLTYQLMVGPIPDGLEVDHLCRNRGCVNPAHLEPVIPAVNKLRGVGSPAINAQKLYCKRGHAFTPENTYVAPSTGYRQCRICVALREKARAPR